MDLEKKVKKVEEHSEKCPIKIIETSELLGF